MLFSFGQQQISNDNFIQKGIENGIANATNTIWDKITNAINYRLVELAKDIVPLVSIGLVCYYVFISYMVLFKSDPKYFSKALPITMIYIIFRLFWKVVLNI